MLTVVPSFAEPIRAKAAVLGEVRKHLANARQSLATGQPEIAVAHADVVLVGDRISYAVEFEPGLTATAMRKCELALADALKVWEDATGADVTFVQERSDRPAMRIRFQRKVEFDGEAVAGYASWRREITQNRTGQATGNYSAFLQIRAVTTRGGAMPTAAISQEIMHEVGHVLGLEDCDNVGRLMGPLDLQRPVSEPGTSELAAVVALRDEARRVKQMALATVRR